VRILTTGNNGLYTNDWMIGDAKTDEVAVLLLGSHAGSSGGARSGTSRAARGFYWSVNTPRTTRSEEFDPDPRTRPSTWSFGPWKPGPGHGRLLPAGEGKIDAPVAAAAIATSPINRPHACDGKVNTSEMAERLVFLAHYGKVTLREKFPEKGVRRMPDLRARPPPDARLLGLRPIENHREAPGRWPDAGSRPFRRPRRHAPPLDPGTAKAWCGTTGRRSGSTPSIRATDGDNWFPAGRRRTGRS